MRGSYLERVFRATEEENRRAILTMLPAGSGGRLLDLGTYNGSFTTRVAARLGAEDTVGVELIEGHAQEARERGIDVIEADLDAGLPFDDESFHFVNANQVIEHVRRTDRFLRELRRVLKPGGMTCISTNNMASWHNVFSLTIGYQPTPAHVSDEVILGNPLNPLHGQDHEDIGQTHLRLFTARGLVELCAHHGLERVELRTAGYYPLPPRAGRIAARIDPLHGAFLIALFRRAG